MSNSLWSRGLHHTRLLCSWDFQARILKWVAIAFSKVSSWSRDWTWVSFIAGRFFTIWATFLLIQLMGIAFTNEDKDNLSPTLGTVPLFQAFFGTKLFYQVLSWDSIWFDLVYLNLCNYQRNVQWYRLFRTLGRWRQGNYACRDAWTLTPVFSAPRGGVTMMTPNLIQEYLYPFPTENLQNVNFSIIMT